MRVPKGFSVFIHADNTVHIVLDNYDGNFLAFQILILDLPLAIASGMTALYLSSAFFLVFGLLLLVIYWCMYNYKDKSQFIFTDNYFYVLEGLHQHEKLRVHAGEIIDTEKTKKGGGTISSSRTLQTTIRKPIYELNIITKEDRILVTKHVGPNGQQYLDEAIHAWLQKVKQ